MEKSPELIRQKRPNTNPDTNPGNNLMEGIARLAAAGAIAVGVVGDASSQGNMESGDNNRRLEEGLQQRHDHSIVELEDGRVARLTFGKGDNPGGPVFQEDPPLPKGEAEEVGVIVGGIVANIIRSLQEEGIEVPRDLTVTPIVRSSEDGSKGAVVGIAVTPTPEPPTESEVPKGCPTQILDPNVVYADFREEAPFSGTYAEGVEVGKLRNGWVVLVNEDPSWGTSQYLINFDGTYQGHGGGARWDYIRERHKPIVLYEVEYRCGENDEFVKYSVQIVIVGEEK